MEDNFFKENGHGAIKDTTNDARAGDLEETTWRSSRALLAGLGVRYRVQTCSRPGIVPRRLLTDTRGAPPLRYHASRRATFAVGARSLPGAVNVQWVQNRLAGTRPQRRLISSAWERREEFGVTCAGVGRPVERSSSFSSCCSSRQAASRAGRPSKRWKLSVATQDLCRAR